jgi:hypothetical protein
LNVCRYIVGPLVGMSVVQSGMLFFPLIIGGALSLGAGFRVLSKVVAPVRVLNNAVDP